MWMFVAGAITATVIMLIIGCILLNSWRWGM